MPSDAIKFLIWLGDPKSEFQGSEFFALGGGVHHGEFNDAHSVTVRQIDSFGASIEFKATVQTCRALGGLTENFRLTDAGRMVREQALKPKRSGPPRVLETQPCHHEGCDQTGSFGFGPPGWTRRTWWCHAHETIGVTSYRTAFDPQSGQIDNVQPKLRMG